MHTIHTLHNIPIQNYIRKNHNCTNPISTFDVANGINQYDRAFLSGLLFIKSDSDLVIFSTKTNGIIGKYNMDGHFRLFVHNDVLYHITSTYVRSIYPELKKIIEVKNIQRLDRYANKYFVLTCINPELRYDIYDDNFTLYHSFNTYPAESNNGFVTHCMCNDKFLVLKQQKLNKYHYFDIENKVIIDTGEFDEWKKINDKLVLVEYNSIAPNNGNLLIKQICGPGEKASNNDCIICFHEIQNKVALISCGHSQFCEKCINSLKTKHCPICRKGYSSILKIY